MENPEVSVILATRNELQMLLVTVLSAVEALRGISGEIVVVDNSEEYLVKSVKAMLSGQIKDGMVKYFRQEKPSSAAAMEMAARQATGKYLFYVDSHCVIGYETIKASLDFYKRHTGEPIAFLHTPIQWAHNSSSAKKMSFRFHRNNMGSWGKMTDHELKVTFKGMPHMIPKEVYHAIGGYGCLAERFVGWGGLIPYLGWKPWLLGYENWAIPQGVAYHFGEYPKCARDYVKYRLYSDNGSYPPGQAHGVAAYVIGGEEFLRQEFEPGKMNRYFASIEHAISIAKEIGGKEREWMLTNQKHSVQELLENPPWGKDF
jgi:glycosyltransferase involved in cell wall biosynthesis